jgi:hypothetical protein
MEPKDVFTVCLGLFSSVLSLLTLYLTQFRRPRIKVRAGPFLHFWHAAPDFTGFYLPVIFQNQSPTRGFVYKAFLTVKDPAGTYFAMKWTKSISIDKDFNYSEVGPSRPFNLDGYAAEADVLMFEWHDAPNAAITFAEGLYELTLNVWTRDRQSPDVFAREKFEILHEVQEIMRQKRISADTTSRFIPLQGHGLLAFSTGYNEVDFSEMPRV